MPEWILNLARRLLALEPGRYQITLTIGKDYHDWTVTELGKVENHTPTGIPKRHK